MFLLVVTGGEIRCLRRRKLRKSCMLSSSGDVLGIHLQGCIHSWKDDQIDHGSCSPRTWSSLSVAQILPLLLIVTHARARFEKPSYTIATNSFIQKRLGGADPHTHTHNTYS